MTVAQLKQELISKCGYSSDRFRGLLKQGLLDLLYAEQLKEIKAKKLKRRAEA